MTDEVDGMVFGQKFNLKGRESIYLLITMILLIAVGYMLWDSTKSMRQDMAIQTTTLSQQHEALNKAVVDLNSSMLEQTYIMTLTQDERDKLKLAMPKSLRDRIKHGE